MAFTAFTSLAKRKQASARLIVRRVPDMNPAHQSELFTVYRYHAVFTNSPLPMLQAEKAHRAHAIVEQVIADLKNGPLAHLPSGSFWANSAWLVCAAMASTAPAPRRPGLGLPRQSHHRHHPCPADQRPRPARPLSPQDHPSPPDRLALADGLGADGRRSSARTTRRRLTHPLRPPGPTGTSRGDHRPARSDKHVLSRSDPPHPAQALNRWADGGSRLSRGAIRGRPSTAFQLARLQSVGRAGRPVGPPPQRRLS